MPISQTYFDNATRLWDKVDLSYKDGPKRDAHRSARRILKALADKLDLKKNQFRVSSNPAGIAVSGEVTLHTDPIASKGVYVQVGQSCLGPGHSIMFRGCRNLADYVGDHNRWGSFEALLGSDEAMEKFARHLQEIGGMMD